MVEIINVLEAMKGTPRPYYLVGEAKYNRENNMHKFCSKVNFTTEGHPSIEDRAKKYLSVPHVNVGDFCFAVWNSVHIMGDYMKYDKRILKDSLVMKIGMTPIPPNIELDLITTITEDKIITRNEKILSKGTIQSFLLRDEEKLLELHTKYFAEKYIKL